MSNKAIPNKGLNRFVCPDCHNKLQYRDKNIYCEKCDLTWRIREGIPCFFTKERYWCNIPKEKMRELNRLAEREGWRLAVDKFILEGIKDHVTEESRADALFYMPLDEKSIVLDLGCMWGALTIPISRYCREIVAADMTLETLRLLDIRRVQEGIANIVVVGANALKLPFADATFDLVILNGVLEWLGYQEDFVATKDYGKTKKKLEKHNYRPEVLQKQGLLEIYRVLKPGGTLFIGIENRFGGHYFVGAKDDHSGLKFTSLLPRKIANWYMKRKLNQEYRTYTHSYSKYKGILRDMGFTNLTFYAALNSYRDCQGIVPLRAPHFLRYYFDHIWSRIQKWKLILWEICLTVGIGKYFIPSFLILATKEEKCVKRKREEK